MTLSEKDVRPQTAASTHRWDYDVLRILAILGVVAIHVFGLILGRPDLRGTDTWNFAVILAIGSNWCVPMFVMVSGALLLAPRAHAAGPGAFLRKRAVRLLPAVIVWHLVYLVVVRHWILQADLVPETVAVNFIDGKVYTALYFLWLILGLYVVAPVIAAFLRDGDARRAQITAIVACLWGAALLVLPLVATQLGFPRTRTDTAVTLWIPYVGLFIAGYAWREPRAEGRRWIWAGGIAVALVTLDIWLFNVAPDFAWLRAFLPVHYVSLPTVGAALAIYLCVIDLCARLRPKERVVKIIGAIGSATFGVFLVHLLLVAVVRRWWPDLYADPAPVAKLELYAMVVVASFAISVAAARVPWLRRIF